MQIAIALYPGLTALDAVGPYEVLRLLPDAEGALRRRGRGPVSPTAGCWSAAPPTATPRPRDRTSCWCPAPADGAPRPWPWRITHEQVPVPIDMDSGRALLDLEPHRCRMTRQACPQPPDQLVHQPSGPDGTGPPRDRSGRRDFRLLWTGQSLSLLGDQFMVVALPLLAVTTLGPPGLRSARPSARPPAAARPPPPGRCGSPATPRCPRTRG
jgi:hypothetical protein